MQPIKYQILNIRERQIIGTAAYFITEEEEDIDADGVGHGLAWALNLLLARIEIGGVAHEEAQQDQQSGAGGEGGSQKARRQNRRQPEVTAGGRPLYR